MEGLEARKLLRLRKEYTEEELVEGYRREYERMQRLLRDADDEEARERRVGETVDEVLEKLGTLM
ncbi:hypothetical protein L6R29_20445 [Myxococcota bacterium]|nr:hypothetical protein [Myxococcota bacterium]